MRMFLVAVAVLLLGCAPADPAERLPPLVETPLPALTLPPEPVPSAPVVDDRLPEELPTADDPLPVTETPPIEASETTAPILRAGSADVSVLVSSVGRVRDRVYEGEPKGYVLGEEVYLVRAILITQDNDGPILLIEVNGESRSLRPRGEARLGGALLFVHDIIPVRK